MKRPWMLEEEARDTWCPHARVADVSGADSIGYSYNRREGGSIVYTGDPKCVGSLCSQWVERGLSVNGKEIGRCGLVHLQDREDKIDI